MKFTILSLVLLLTTCLHLVALDVPAKISPQFKARVVCFNGKLDSGSSCAASNVHPDGTFQAKGKMKCGWPGRVSEVEWILVERRPENDVYKFTRRFPLGADAASTTNKTVEFRDKRVVVFEDQVQAIVIEPAGK
jgi:hypothetical protein